MNSMFLIIADAHTKWLDIHVTSFSTAPITIEKLRRTFSTMDPPETVGTDNCNWSFSYNTSHKFAEFMRASEWLYAYLDFTVPSINKCDGSAFCANI